MATHGNSAASTVVVSYSPVRGRVREELTTPSYAGYLRKTRRGRVTDGDEWEEFVSCGCGSTTDVVLRVERVEGGSTIGPETDLEFVPHERTGAEPGD